MYSFKILNCPPKEAIEPNNLIVYRLVFNRKVKYSDMLSHTEMNPNKDWGDRQCEFSALSVSKDAKSLDGLKKIPKFKNKVTFVAKLKLSKNSGRIFNNHDSHINWWPFKDFNRLSAIEEVVNHVITSK